MTSMVRSFGLAVLLCATLIGLACFTARTYAQDGGQDRQLSVGDIVTGTLDAENFVQVYSLAASQGDTISIEVETTTDTLAPVVILTDPRGNLVVQDIDITSATTAALTDVEMPVNGTYYISVMRGTGAEGDASGEFTLRLSGTQQVGGQSVTLEDGGLTFELVWNAAVNLNLEVRDPVGGTVHAFNLGAPSGGTLDADTNVNCNAATANSPTETIAWPSGNVPAGSYEIIVHYFDACTVGGPQQFTLNVSANAEDAQTLSGTVNPGQEYLARLILEPDGTWTLNNGGINAGLNVNLFSNQIADAAPIALGNTVNGTITNNTPAQAYTFDATSGTTVSISMQAQNGSLDTYLVLLGPDNTPLVSNDDVEDSTNSAIDRNLAVDGTYTIIATRYGLTIGGTEGEYTLALNTATAGTTTPTTTTDTTTGTPAATNTAALPNGSIEVTLTWLTNADVQLLVRDPNGESVFDDQPQQVRSGGVLEQDGNRNCTDTTTTPVSYIYWPQSRLLSGVYEVEVWFQDTCGDNNPVNFSLTATVLDQTIVNTTQPISLDAHFMVTFNVASDGTATLGDSGFFDMTNANSLNYQSLLDTASSIAYGGTVSGSITGQQHFQIYSFEGQEGDIVSIRMNQTGGTLDPAVYLISPEGIQIDYNDDVAPGGENRNSAITEKTLAFTGTYYIIATHYGLNLGGTQGTYTLALVQE